jgi:hypothetical protein
MSVKTLLDSNALELSGVVANSAMNRERVCVGKNSYARELSFDPIAFLKSRVETQGQAAWLDLCCGRGRALIEAAEALAPYSFDNKLGLMQNAASWLKEDGVFLANLDPVNLKFPNSVNAGNKIIRDLRNIGFEYQAGKHLIVCEGRKVFTLTYQYLGADDAAGPNYTGQAAVNSHYDQL